MSSRLLPGSIAAVALAGTVAIGAQAPAQQPSQKSDAQKQTVMVTGCIAKETDVLKRSAVAGNVGMGDEFVITNSVLSRTGATTEPPAAEPKSEPTGTTGKASSFGRVFRATGDKESELKNYVGKRVEITGSFKHDADAKAAAPTGAAELTTDNTPEITIDAIKPASGTCAPAAK